MDERISDLKRLFWVLVGVGVITYLGWDQWVVTFQKAFTRDYTSVISYETDTTKSSADYLQEDLKELRERVEKLDVSPNPEIEKIIAQEQLASSIPTEKRPEPTKTQELPIEVDDSVSRIVPSPVIEVPITTTDSTPEIKKEEAISTPIAVDSTMVAPKKKKKFLFFNRK